MHKKHLFCGIDCVFPDSSDVWDFFNFSNITFGNFYFSIVDVCWFSGDIFPPKLSPAYFRELARQTSYVGFLVMHLYPEGVPAEEINDYADFLRSNCEMIVLLCDGCYVEIYCKNHIWLQTLLRDAKKVPGAIVEEKYEDTDPRSIMYV